MNKLSCVFERPSVRRRAAGIAACVAIAASAPLRAQTPADASAPRPPTAAASTPIGYPTVATARAALESHDGDSTVVVHTDGWVIINEPAAAAQWSFTPPDHAAYPAVVRRIIHRGPNRAVSVETSTLCEAPASACDQLLQEFATMNDRITQAVRGGAGPVSPQP